MRLKVGKAVDYLQYGNVKISEGFKIVFNL